MTDINLPNSNVNEANLVAYSLTFPRKVIFPVKKRKIQRTGYFLLQKGTLKEPLFSLSLCSLSPTRRAIDPFQSNISILAVTVPCILESCIKIKIYLNFYFHTSFEAENKNSS